MRSIVFSLLAAGFVLGAPGSDFRQLGLKSATGTVIRPLSDTAKPVCLIFILTDCPIANQYSPEIKRIVSRYTLKGATFYVVVADPDATAAQISKHAREFGMNVPFLLDNKRALAKSVGATRSPEAAVYRAGKRLYLGRIDDLYPSLGVRRDEARTHELRDALDAALAGKNPPKSRTEAVGCILPPG